MVLPSTPRPTLTPPCVLVSESEDLVLQPEAASTMATDTSVTAPRFVFILHQLLPPVDGSACAGVVVWCQIGTRGVRRGGTGCT